MTQFRTRLPFSKLLCASALIVLAACAEEIVPIGEGDDQDSGSATRGSGGASGSDDPVGGSSCAGAASNCGGSGALDSGCEPGFPYGKAGEGKWKEGTAGNPYGWPRGLVTNGYCTGFGFQEECSFWEVCAVYCRLDEHCPSPAGGPPAVCRDAYVARPPALGNYCVLPCPGGQPCPDGMKCVNHPYGHGEICMWESDPLL